MAADGPTRNGRHHVFLRTRWALTKKASWLKVTVSTWRALERTGWPYVQHRGGPRGFLKVLDEHTIGFADFRGNRQYISAGNLMTNDKVALILVDYPRQARLKILGHVQIYEDADAKEWIEKLRESGEATPIERVFIIHVDAFDWNCQQHITRRFTEEQIRNALDPLEKRMEQLVMENEKLRAEIARAQENKDAGVV